MTSFEHAAEADQRHAFRQQVLMEIATAIRNKTLLELQTKYPEIPEAIISEAKRMADLAEAETWWNTISTSLPPA